MSLSTFFSKQARKPTGLFGRLIMSKIFDYGNASLNNFVLEAMEVEENDHILEFGFGTGKLIYEMAKLIHNGHIEGVDFSSSMVSIAQKRNKKHLAMGKVSLNIGDINEINFGEESFSKICTVNTLYFWLEPERLVRKILSILKPEGKFVVAFQEVSDSKREKLSGEIFRFYSKDDVRNLLLNSGFNNGINILSKDIGPAVMNCAVAIK